LSSCNVRYSIANGASILWVQIQHRYLTKYGSWLLEVTYWSSGFNPRQIYVAFECSVPMSLWKHMLLVWQFLYIFLINIISTKRKIFLELVLLIVTNYFQRTEPECDTWGSHCCHFWDITFSVVTGRQQRFAETCCRSFQTRIEVWRLRQKVPPKCRACWPDWEENLNGSGFNFYYLGNYIKFAAGY
jgi:hypothetical protein